MCCALPSVSWRPLGVYETQDRGAVSHPGASAALLAIVKRTDPTREASDFIGPWVAVRLRDLSRSVGGVWERGRQPPNEDQRPSFSNQLFTLSGTTLLERFIWPFGDAASSSRPA